MIMQDLFFEPKQCSADYNSHITHVHDDVLEMLNF